MTNPPIPVTLLPCPFCGGDAKAYEAMLIFHDWEIECQKCGVNGGNYNEHEDKPRASELNKTAAVAAWNTRAHPSPDLSLVEKIQELPCYVARPGEGTYECRLDNLCPACELRQHYAGAAIPPINAGLNSGAATPAPAPVSSAYRDINKDMQVIEENVESIGKAMINIFNPCEIPVNRDLLRAAIYADVDNGITGTIPSARTKHDLTDSIMGTITPFLAKPEPVSVSLEKMSNVVAALYTNWETFTAQRPSPRETAKAVLDAAGISYE